MATEGFKPYVAIYSTFFKSLWSNSSWCSYSKITVRFAIDRAGQVGSDGPTHAGSFDLTYLSTLPNFIIMAPSNQSELVKMMKTSASIDNCPSAFRYQEMLES